MPIIVQAVGLKLIYYLCYNTFTYSITLSRSDGGDTLMHLRFEFVARFAWQVGCGLY